jgi:hypothetical protein
MKKAKRRRKAEQQRIAQNIGRLHAVKCEWCNLKMACSCYFDECRDQRNKPHPLVMCPRCQVTEFINMMFGGNGRKDGSPSS